jgi:hypothetical protein
VCNRGQALWRRAPHVPAAVVAVLAFAGVLLPDLAPEDVVIVVRTCLRAGGSG